MTSLKLFQQLELILKARDQEGRTPIIVAASVNNMAFCRTLLKMGANINAEDKRGKTPLSSVLTTKHVLMSDWLVAAGAVVKSAGSSDLLDAEKNGHLWAAEKLVEDVADLEEKDGNGDTALLLACENGHRQMVQRLVEDWGKHWTSQ